MESFRRHFDGEQSIKKQPSRGVPRKRCFENIQHVYRRARMPKCDFNKVANNNNNNFVRIFRKLFYKNTNEGLLSDMDQNAKKLANWVGNGNTLAKIKCFIRTNLKTI